MDPQSSTSSANRLAAFNRWQVVMICSKFGRVVPRVLTGTTSVAIDLQALLKLWAESERSITRRKSVAMFTSFPYSSRILLRLLHRGSCDLYLKHSEILYILWVSFLNPLAIPSETFAQVRYRQNTLIPSPASNSEQSLFICDPRRLSPATPSHSHPPSPPLIDTPIFILLRAVLLPAALSLASPYRSVYTIAGGGPAGPMRHAEHSACDSITGPDALFRVRKQGSACARAVRRLSPCILERCTEPASRVQRRTVRLEYPLRQIYVRPHHPGMAVKTNLQFRHSYLPRSAARTGHPLAFPFAASFYPRRARGAAFGAAPMNAASFSYDEGQPLSHQHAIPLDDPDARWAVLNAHMTTFYSRDPAWASGACSVNKSTILCICVHDGFVASAGSDRRAAVWDLAQNALVKSSRTTRAEELGFAPAHGGECSAGLTRPMNNTITLSPSTTTQARSALPCRTMYRRLVAVIHASICPSSGP
ncbi:hypothetical protein C8R45DRAFT_1177572 [Mycena sanguinolenta]|nr:hypothetical protein C8R45DRAFT_1177572 [Mycena sanguinolenta]